MQTLIAYNQNEVKKSGTKQDINNGYKLWLDLIDPTPSEINEIQQSFDLDKNALGVFSSKSKKPQIRMLGTHTFRLILDIKYKDLKTLATEALYSCPYVQTVSRMENYQILPQEGPLPFIFRVSARMKI